MSDATFNCEPHALDFPVDNLEQLESSGLENMLREGAVAVAEVGALALQSQRRGPKTHYRRTAEVVRQVIRHRFLDPEASAEVIAQKLSQSGWEISIRSVQRVIEEFGLQKKTLRVQA